MLKGHWLTLLILLNCLNSIESTILEAGANKEVFKETSFTTSIEGEKAKIPSTSSRNIIKFNMSELLSTTQEFGIEARSTSNENLMGHTQHPCHGSLN